jgi:flagellar M-ring protein FliF
MSIGEYWAALGRAQKAGFVLGLLLIAALTAGVGVWAWRDPWVAVATNLSAERVVALTRELAREKLEHRIAEDGATVEVRQSAVGRARASAATGGVGLPASVGLEIFKETDFSTTDFAQRVNYQRALQGELTRTLQTIAGVRQARVHVVLPEGSVLKRGATKASAAVTLALALGKTLSRSQVRGVQRLVASSVPEIKADEVVVLDESGASLSRDGGSGNDAELSTSQLDLKRQVDGYFEAKLTRLLEEIAPGVQATLSVDTVLDYKQLRVTVEEPIAAPAGKDAERATGVVLKERQVQRSSAAAGNAAANGAAGVESTDLEFEYKVGHRVEQSLLAPGTIRRVSVAVALHGAPADLAAASIESLVAHAVGIDRQRGDSVMVLMLGRMVPAVAQLESPPVVQKMAPVSAAPALPPALAGVSYAAVLALLGVAGILALLGLRRERAERAKAARLREVAEQVRHWLAEEPTHGRG